MKTLLNLLSRSLLFGFRFTQKYSRSFIFLIFLFTIFICFHLKDLKTVLAIEDIVDDSFKSKQDLADLYKNFSISQTMSLLIVKDSKNNFDADFLCKLSNWLNDERLKNSTILSSVSPFDLREGSFQDSKLTYPLLLKSPCVNAQDVPQGLDRIAQSPWGFALVGPHQNHLLLQFDLKDAPEGGRFGRFDPNYIESIHRSFEEKVGVQPKVLSYWVGGADFQYYLYKGLGRVNFLNLFLLFFLVLILRFAFGTWRCGIIFSASLVLTGALLYGGMSLFHIPVDILSKSLFLMVAVSALEDYVFISYAQLKNESSWRQAYRKMLVPGFLTSLTTVMGFGSLCISDLQIIRRFGFWASVGAILEWGILFFVLPALQKNIPPLRRLTRKGKAWIAPSIEKTISIKPSWALSRILLLAFPLSLWGAFHLVVSDVPMDMFPANHSFRQGIDYIKGEAHWETSLSLVFHNFKNRDDNEKLLNTLIDDPNVAFVQNPYLITDFLRKDKPKVIGDLIERNARSAGLLRREISDDDDVRAEIFVKNSDLASIEALGDRVVVLCKPLGCVLSGAALSYAEFSQKVPKTLLESLIVSLLLVALILAAMVRATGKSEYVSTVVASFWGPALIFGFMALFQIKVNFLTCVFASVLVGLTGDNAIQYLYASRKNRDWRGLYARGAGSVICGLTMALASLIFLGSYFVPPRLFGILLSLGMLLSLFGDLWLLQGLLAIRGSKRD